MMQQMRQRWLKPCSSLKRDERGISAVEFALTASFTMILIMGGIEFSMLTYTKHMLSLATNEASRAAKASVTLEYNELGGTAQDLAARKQARLDSFTNRLNAVMAGLPGDRLPVVRTQVFSNFNNYGQGDQLLVDSNNNKLCDAGDQYRERNGTSGFQPDPSVAAQLSLGQAGDVVRFDVEYDLVWLLDCVAADTSPGRAAQYRAAARIGGCAQPNAARHHPAHGACRLDLELLKGVRKCACGDALC
jgi:Flp pilus assembly pilin Flp